MKRLLSKPALPSSSSSASPSTHPGVSRSPHQYPRTPPTHHPAAAAAAPGSESSSLHTSDEWAFSGRRGWGAGRDRALPLAGSSVSSTPISTPRDSTSSLGHQQQPPLRSPPTSAAGTKPRTALKRRPSGPRSASLPSSPPPSAPTPPSSVTAAARPTSKPTPSPHLTIDSTLSRRGSPSSGSPLTPAGAVAEAYKQQEQKRSSSQASKEESRSNSGSGSGSGRDDTPKIPTAPLSDLHESDEALFTSPTAASSSSSHLPYFTVLGSTSGRVVAIGGPDGYHVDGRHHHRQSKSQSQSGRSLTRRVSARWKRAVNGDRAADAGAGEDGGDSQGVRSAGAALPGGERSGWRDKALPDPGEHIVLSAKAWSPGRVEEDGKWKSGKVLKGKSVDRGKGGGGREKENDGEGGRIWKLMRRISASGLRDKYQHQQQQQSLSDRAPPPPVPALPKDYGQRSMRQSVDNDSPGVLSRFMASRSSMSAAPTARHNSRSPRASFSHAPKPGPINPSSSRRPSTTTRSSSSPVSSDFASSQFFRPTHSARSSSSSYGEEQDVPPPVPTSSLVVRHIIPPSELYRMNVDHENEIEYPVSSDDVEFRVVDRGMGMPVSDSLPPRDYSPEETRASLPFPPRRVPAAAKTSPQEVSNSKTSPAVKLQTSPTPAPFSNETPRLSLTLHNLPFDSASELIPSRNDTPPPRPSKSSRRPRTAVPPHAQSAAPIETLFEDGSDSGRIRYDPGDPHRNSSGTFSNASTVRQRSNTFNTPQTPTYHHRRPTITDTASTKSPVSAARSPLTFRELGTSPSPRTPLTAQEKAEIWDDLLERSDRAGGTIRLRGQEPLMSEMRSTDESRLSNYTED